jgi:cytochrome oxidase Cu insertion factor (SCO1/SenC/PrrC family)
MRRTSALLAAALLVALAGQVPAAQQATPERRVIDVSAMGPQVGDVVPDFSLTDQFGKVWTRQSIMGQRGAMVVFFRSADW